MVAEMNYRINPIWAANDAALAFNVEIAAYVRAELLAYLAEGEGTTSDYPHRAGMILTPEAQGERDWFESVFGNEGCTCFIFQPCCYCTHPGNPRNQEEDEDCWVPVLNGGVS